MTRLIGLSMLVVAIAGLTSCSRPDPWVDGQVTSVSNRGDRVCIDTSVDTPPRIVCGTMPDSTDVTFELGDCLTARRSPHAGGKFTYVAYAGHCQGYLNSA